MKRGITLLVLVFLTAHVALTHAWWCYGHMLVANIAKNAMCPGTYKLIESLLQPQAQYSPVAPDFVQAACWADDEKPTNGLFNTWHYINLPLVIDRPPLNRLINNPTSGTVVWAIETLKKTLASSNASPIDVARALYLLIHFVGDLHQPLHATTLFSDKFPTGDVGGNEYKINYQNYKNLHAFWDSGANLWPDDPQRPLAPTAAQKLNSTASELMRKYPPSTFGDRLKDYKVENWAYESFAIARDVAYKAPQAPSALPTDYIKSAQDACAAQVALGGYRLAQIIHDIFDCL